MVKGESRRGRQARQAGSIARDGRILCDLCFLLRAVDGGDVYLALERIIKETFL